MTDTELVDFVEKHGVQVWPQRQRSQIGPGGDDKIRSVPGEILNWTAQFPTPRFLQITRSHWRDAVSDLIKVIEETSQQKLI